MPARGRGTDHRAAAVSASTRTIVSAAGERKLFASLAADTRRTGGWRRATRATPAGIRASAGPIGALDGSPKPECEFDHAEAEQLLDPLSPRP
jgi:hypothetical protein